MSAIEFKRIERDNIFFQQWNSLSRFQKNLIALIFFGGLLLGGFLFLQGQKQHPDRKPIISNVNDDKSYNNNNNNSNDDKKIQIVPIKVSKAIT